MAAAWRRRRLFPLRPRQQPPQRLLLAATAATFTLLFLVLVLLSTSSPSSPPPSGHHVAIRGRCSGAASLRELGDATVSMLPKDLPFTVFAPSAAAFHRVLNLRPANGSDVENQTNDVGGNTYAVLSRVLGFSAVPRRLLAADVAPRALQVESVSGLMIHVARDGDALVANGVRSECVDVVRGETVVHVMAGVLMDAEFERSFAVRSDNLRG